MGSVTVNLPTTSNAVIITGNCYLRYVQLSGGSFSSINEQVNSSKIINVGYPGGVWAFICENENSNPNAYIELSPVSSNPSGSYRRIIYIDPVTGNTSIKFNGAHTLQIEGKSSIVIANTGTQALSIAGQTVSAGATITVEQDTTAAAILTTGDILLDIDPNFTDEVTDVISGQVYDTKNGSKRTITPAISGGKASILIDGNPPPTITVNYNNTETPTVSDM